eukprot:maker-scaffold_54-snap-gene-1.21-mRNA-1 protein AED:0.30 eAED:0.30 QI:228/1/1/1/1/1/2/293/274
MIHQTKRFFSQNLKSSYENIIVNPKHAERVALITLNRPKALNALCTPLIEELNHATSILDKDPEIGAMIITGNGKAFAAGADIKEMQPLDFVGNYKGNLFANWADITKIQTPVIAAVNGFALGGGCELAMSCDMIFASENAKFGQPEITLGTIPGCGGTQRLIRAIGKSRAMDLCLTGEFMDAKEAYERGLVARLYETPEILVEKSTEVAVKIGQFGKAAVQIAKEAVNVAEEVSLQEGLRFERRMFHATFATEDRKEGMTAFVEKRKANFTHK